MQNKKCIFTNWVQIFCLGLSLKDTINVAGFSESNFFRKEIRRQNRGRKRKRLKNPPRKVTVLLPAPPPLPQGLLERQEEGERVAHGELASVQRGLGKVFLPLSYYLEFCQNCQNCVPKEAIFVPIKMPHATKKLFFLFWGGNTCKEENCLGGGGRKKN